MKFYSLDRILEQDAVYNIIMGERSNGKTYAVLKYAVEQYFKTGQEFAYVRRWKEDVIGQRASNLFKALINNDEISRITNGIYQGVYYFAGRFYLCNYDDETGKAIYNDKDVLGYTFALTDTEHNKSISYPDVGLIMFDEFITKGAYLYDEFVLFMNTISTIVRQRADVKVFMLGNTVNKYCPYFNEMGLNKVSTMEQGTIDLYKYGEKGKLTVAVEYCSPTKKGKASNYYFAFNNPKLEMITGGVWEIDVYPHLPIKYNPKDIMFIYFIIFDGKTYQCEIIQKESELFTYIHEKTTPIKYPDKDLIYTLDYNHKINYNRSIYKTPLKIHKKILFFFMNDKVFYQDNTVGDAINNYLKIAKGV